MVLAQRCGLCASCANGGYYYGATPTIQAALCVYAMAAACGYTLAPGLAPGHATYRACQAMQPIGHGLGTG